MRKSPFKPARLRHSGAAAGLIVHRDIAAAALSSRGAERRIGPTLRVLPQHRVGVIRNERSHRNRLAGGIRPGEHAYGPDVLLRGPRTLADLSRAMLDFAEARIEVLVVDGGDGTLRDVLTCAGRAFDRLPRIALVPSGKTNALALDLGIPADWTVEQAIAGIGDGAIRLRTPIEILRPGSTAPDLRGFLLGAGAFVGATALAQRAHRAGAFNSFAVGLSLAWSLLQTAFGRPGNPWRKGERMLIREDDGREVSRDLYLLLASTLQRLPLNLKPFGPVREGLKLLAVDAPPARLLTAPAALLRGSTAPWLSRAGYHRFDIDRLDVTIDGGFILDGELYEGGPITIRRGAPITFLTP